MNNRPNLETQRLIIRVPQKSDVLNLVRYHSENEKFFAPTDPPRPEDFLTEGYWQKRVEAAHLEFETDQAVRFILTQKSGSQELVGTVNYTQIFRGPFQACYLGYSLAECAQGQGYMNEALRCSIAYIFDEKKLHRIMANHLPENERSANVLQKLGFERDGYARDYLFIRGSWRDHVLNSLTNPAWTPVGI